MALESVRQNPVFGSLFQRKPAGQNQNVLSFPKFGTATTVPVQNPVKVQLQTDTFAPSQVYQAPGNNTARIVLLPKAEKENFFLRALDTVTEVLSTAERRLATVSTAPREAQPAVHRVGIQPQPQVEEARPLGKVELVLASMASRLAAAITPETKMDDNGNLFGEFKVEEAEYPPTPTKAETKETDAATARANTKGLIAAFQHQLEKVPAGFTNVTVELPEALPAGVNKEEVVREIAKLTQLNGYNYNQFRQEVSSNSISNLSLNRSALKGLTAPKAQAAATEGQTLGDAMNFTRQLVDSPANPERTRLIADAAKSLDNGTTLAVQVRDKAWIQQQGMGMFLSVGDGNAPGLPDSEPRMVEMVYTPEGFDPATGKTVLLVGKGIVFDTGGTNLKPSEYIHNMRGDMAGGGAVIGAMKAIDAQKLKGVKVVGIVPLTENRIGHNASLENRSVTARNGKKVAISNTDAEGRLVLGDALHYGMETYKPDVVADIATLTGGKVRALGEQNSVALSGNNRDLLKAVDGIEKAGLGRRTATLPLTLGHHRWVTRDGAKTDTKGGFADVYNSVGKAEAQRYGVLSTTSSDRDYMLAHSAQGAAFLREFLTDPQTPWVHYDMAGAEFDKADAARGNWEWATGFGVEDLYNLTKQVAEGKLTPDRTKTEVVKAFNSADVDEV